MFKGGNLHKDTIQKLTKGDYLFLVFHYSLP